MRNDYPNHPAGPITEPINPQEVIEVCTPTFNNWIFIVCGFMIGSLAFILSFVSKINPNPQNAGSGAGLGMFFGFSGLALIAYGFYSMSNRQVVLRIRPDGLDFPKDKIPSLAWNHIQRVDIATLNIIGGGGARDFLAIKLAPGTMGPNTGPFLSLPIRAALKLVGWDFDICLHPADMDLNCAHASMQIRARHEAAQGQAVATPPGLEPISTGALPPSPPAAQVLGMSRGRMLAIAFFIIGGTIRLSRAINVYLEGGFSHTIPPDRFSSKESLIISVILFGIAALLLPPAKED